MGLTVLSLFDGISCGRVALERAGVSVDTYYSSEIEPNAIKISKNNYPDIIQLGDITKITEEMLDSIMPIDIVIGGSPCQDLSNYKYDRGEVTGLNGEKSGLFYEYIRILKYVRPKYFLLENVASMEEKWKNMISDILGVKPIMINSALVCAAERKRLYWTNIPNVTQPSDKNILLKDIVSPSCEVPEKYWYTKYPVTIHDGDVKVKATIHLNGHRQSKEVYGLNHKCNTLLCDGNGGNLVKKILQDERVRKLTPLEYEKLQTLPDGYTEGVADCHRYTTIGNGWTVDVIAHIFKGLTEQTNQNGEMIMSNKTKMIEIFSGIGAQERAIRQLGIPYEITATMDVDKDAIVSYAAMRYDLEKEMENFNFPSKEDMVSKLQAMNVGFDFAKNKHTITNKTNIDKVKLYYISNILSKNLGDVSKLENLPYADIVFHSSPCFVPGIMVLTDSGFKNIENISVDDMVLTHTNQYQKVIKPMKNYCNSFVYKINTMCSDPIFVTEEHPFYVRKMHRVWNNPRRVYERVFDQPEWVKAKDLTKDYYVGTAINQKSIIPKWDGIDFTWSNSSRTEHSNKLGKYMNNKNFWWIIGRYIGDGWLVDGYGENPSYGVKICCAKSELSEVTTILDKINIKYTTTEDRTVFKVQINSKELYAFCLQFGRGAANKRLTNTIIDLPVDLLSGFLDGYISADGCFTQDKYKATSVSKELIYGIAQCVAKVYHIPFSVYKTNRPKTCIIEGRTVNQKDSYEITFKFKRSKQDQAFYEDGYVWCPIKSIEKEDYDGYVYNIEVENDNSYTVQNIIVHNCQDYSCAGLGAGGDEGSGTRSSLMFESLRLINTSKPKFVIWENVSNVLSPKHKHNFIKMLEKLTEMGYESTFDVLNAKNYGIPQNRLRIFCVSHRIDEESALNDNIIEYHSDSKQASTLMKEIKDNPSIKVWSSFQFPKSITLTTRLKDILEKNVDEKYYLPDERIEKILNSTFMKEKSNSLKDEIKVVGNYMPSNHDASRVVDVNGVAPTVKENHGTVTAIVEPRPIKVGQVSSDGSQAGTVYSIDGISQTICAGTHGYATGNILEPQIITHNIPQTVRVRTYEVDTQKLISTLKEAKKNIGLTNQSIATKMNLPLTTVEHWFRTDECSSIPDPEVWEELKNVLNITTTEFGKSIMTFEERDGVFEKSQRVYDTNGIAATITSAEADLKILEPQEDIKERFFRQVDETISENQCEPGDTVDAFNKKVNHSGVSPTITTRPEGFKTAILPVVEEPFIVASRGRNPENTSDRTAGVHTEQRLEPNFSGTTNCITSVAKDNYVCEPQVLRAERTEYGKAIRKQYEAGEVAEKIGNMRELKPRTDGISNTITTLQKDNYVCEPQLVVCEERADEGIRLFKDDCVGTLRTIDACGDKRVIEKGVRRRIRKLTPLECWRLMGFTDEDCNRASKYVSVSQLYHQAGNSIVVSVLTSLFSSLFIKDGHKAEVWTKYLIHYNDEK